MSLADPNIVRQEYATEAGLAARASVYGGVEFGEGDARRVALDAVAEVAPRRVLEVGCGRGEFAERMVTELGADVIAIDQSERMVELTRARRIDARVADAQALPFTDGSFDCVVANWMLYHVPDLDRVLAGFVRVLQPRGRLVAATNSVDHLSEVWQLVGPDRRDEPERFFAETAEQTLRPHFACIERRDIQGQVIFDDRAAVQRYIGASVAHKDRVDQVPELAEPLVARTINAVFVADKA